MSFGSIELKTRLEMSWYFGTFLENDHFEVQIECFIGHKPFVDMHHGANSLANLSSWCFWSRNQYSEAYLRRTVSICHVENRWGGVFFPYIVGCRVSLKRRSIAIACHFRHIWLVDELGAISGELVRSIMEISGAIWEESHTYWESPDSRALLKSEKLGLISSRALLKLGLFLCDCQIFQSSYMSASWIWSEHCSMCCNSSLGWDLGVFGLICVC